MTPRLSLATSTFAMLVFSATPLWAATLLGSIDDHDYYLTDELITHAEGRLAAEELQTNLGRNSYLAAITTQGEQDAIVGLLQSLPMPSEARIGLSDELSEGTYLWDSGEPFAFSNWIPGEPNDNPTLGGEDSVVLHNLFSFQWNDLAGSIPRSALIEVAEVIPEPGSICLVVTGMMVLGSLRLRNRVQQFWPRHI